MEKENQRPLQWHPAFQAAMQIELAEYREWLKFDREHNLTQKPLQIDLLIIWLAQGKRIEKPLGRIFRRYNIVEYKGPSDYLSVNDFYKVTAYACLYQSDTRRVMEIRPEDITITMVSGRYPAKLIRHLEERYQARIYQKFPGIYYVEGTLFPLQIIRNTELSGEENVWLSRLRTGLEQKKDIEVLAREYRGKEKDPAYAAVMELIVRANRKEYEEAKEMCEALRELFADEIAEREKQGIRRGRIEGKAEGKQEGETLKLIGQIARKVKKGKTIEEAAEELEESPEQILPFYRLVKEQGPETGVEEIFRLYREQRKKEENQ